MRQTLTSLAYGFALGLAVGIVLEASGLLVRVDALIGQLIKEKHHGEPRELAGLPEPGAGSRDGASEARAAR